MTPEASQDLLQQLCADLRLLWIEAGGPTLRVLSGRVRLSKSQVGNILNGRIRQPPEWDVVSGLVTSFVRYAHDRGRTAYLSVATGIDEFWRPRFAVVEHAFRPMPRGGRTAPPQRAARAAPAGRATPAPSGRPVPVPAVRSVPGWVVLHQLPGAVHHFAGRTHELQTLTKLIDQGEGRTVVISAIDGTAGIGKTALAVHWAHRVSDRFPDGQLYVNLRGFDPTSPPLTAAEALRAFLEALGVRPEQIPASPEAQVGLYRTLLSDRRVLVVLDNARDAEQVRPLLPAHPEAMAVVTSRNRLTGLVASDGAHLITLDLLSLAQSQDLLARRLGHERAAREPDALDEIIDRCARLPLALAIVAARAAAYPQLPLAALAEELREADVRLDALDTGDAATDVRNVFSWSYRRLDPEVARLFRLLSLHPGPDCSRAAVASVAGRPVSRELAELTRAHLLTEGPSGRYSCHDLLRVYAAERTHAEDPDGERRAAQRRLLDHYARSAQAAGALLNPAREPATLSAPAPGVCSELFADRSAAMEWFAAELPVLLGAVTLATDAGFDEYAYQLAWGVSTYLHLQGRWAQRAAVQTTALAAAQRSGDRRWQARIHRELTGAYAWMGRWEESLDHSRRAVELFGELHDDVGLARTHRSICLLMERWGKLPEALEHAQRSLELFLGTDDRAGQAYAYNSVGWYHALVGSYEEALTECRQAIARLRDIGDRGGEATAWDSLGYAHHRLGHYEEAMLCYRRALDLLREVGDQYFEAPTLDHLGDTLHALGDAAAARDAWRQALAILEELQPAEAAAVRAKLSDTDPTPVPAADQLV